MTDSQAAGHLAGPPLPFRQFIVKLHSRCNLACDYCYVYRMADQRWRSRPPIMSRETMDWVAVRVAEHVRAHGLGTVEVIIHGGEPLLAGPDAVAYCVNRIRTAIGPDTQVLVGIHTNGTLLDSGYLRLFHELDIRVSVSLDGAGSAHDLHRQRRDGTGTHAAVVRALRELCRDEYRKLFIGLLCTIDARNDPVETYEELVSFGPPMIDFLLPHGNWSSPPFMRTPDSSNTPYADWLVRVFDRWYDAPVRQTRVRIFEEIINVLLGGRSAVEGVGLSPAAMVVVETDGAIELSDILTTAFEGAAVTGLDVRRNSFDTALRHSGFVARQQGLAGLPTGCRDCGIRRICGGGLPAHRYRADRGFDNPSVYCPDLVQLIRHIRDRVAADLRQVLEQGR